MNALSEVDLRKPIVWIVAGVIVCAVVGLLVLHFWPKPEVDETYGKMGGLGRKSLNGTWVLAQMVRQAGHSVKRSGRLSAVVKNRADCIVWFSVESSVPHDSVIAWLEEWLRAKPGRLLIYVGRHFEAGPIYWKAMSERFADHFDPMVREIIAERQTSGEEKLNYLATQEGECPWFSLKPLPEVVRPKRLEMHPQWQVAIDPGGLEMELRSQMIPAEGAEILLRAQQHVLVARLPRGESQILLVNNGSFLLNMMLVNREHRKLAARLVQAIGESGTPRAKEVYFLELPWGYQVVPRSNSLEEPSAYRFLTVYPLNLVLIHLFLLGVIFAMARFPRLGRGYEPDIVSRISFDAHLAAMARWLRRSRDYQFVQEVLGKWERIKGPSGHARLGSRRSGKSRLLRS
ncbi:MAG: DUF4350 domain-containing protein [Thermogutta sp.]